MQSAALKRMLFDLNNTRREKLDEAFEKLNTFRISLPPKYFDCISISCQK